jgi:hypothetical protein
MNRTDARLKWAEHAKKEGHKKGDFLRHDFLGGYYFRNVYKCTKCRKPFVGNWQ